jgi:3-phosphoshikimate 1-carboxyvinyltransferase
VRTAVSRGSSGADGTTVTGPRSGRLAAFDLDCGDFPDLVPMLAVLALFADGPCVIGNAANLRHKESDRLRALATELSRLGAVVEERLDGLRIVPGPLRGARIATYNDHRIAMAFAIAGLAIPGVVIEDPSCVGKSFPAFWTTLAELAPGSAMHHSVSSARKT